MVCSTFSRRGLSVLRSSLLAKGGTSRKRLSSHLHYVLTQSNKVSPRALQTAVVLAIFCFRVPSIFFEDHKGSADRKVCETS